MKHRVGVCLVLIALVGWISYSPTVLATQLDATQLESLDRPGSGDLSLPNGSTASADNAESEQSFGLQQVQQNLEGDFKAKDIAAANTWAHSLQLADWLGPLAPIAMSPFFGMACLTGLSLFGPEWITDNALLGSTGPLHNEVLFFVFVALTLVTSIPRFTKVAKPFAQAMDQLETYSVIVILLAIKLLTPTSETVDGTEQIAMVQLGIFSMTVDALLMLAMAINIIVVNTVKFFFEVLVWLTPIPTVDAIFEVCNKSLCAALMAVYAFSPAIATIVNLVILAIAFLMFRWISRRVRFFRTMVLDPVLARVWPSYGQFNADSLIVFNKEPIGPFKAKSRLKLQKSEDGWNLSEANWWLPAADHAIGPDSEFVMKRGWVTHSIDFSDGGTVHRLSTSRRFDNCLEQVAGGLGIKLQDSELQDSKSKEVSTSQIAAEFA